MDKKHEEDTTVTVSSPTKSTPSAAVVASDKNEHAKSSGGTVVLQWLAYAFWFWFVVSVTWLAGVVISFTINHNSSYDWVSGLAYPLAATIIMFIVSLVTDVLYSRKEPTKKSGAAYVIMLLHVVPFVLIAISALVTIVFTLITMMLSSGPTNSANGALQAMWVAIVSLGLFAMLAIRAFFGGVRPILRIIAWGVFGLAAIGFTIAALVGPAAEASRTKQDRLIETALPSLAADIRNYATKNHKLPATISDITHSASSSADTTQAMLDQKLVTYKPNTLPAVEGNSYSPSDASSATVKPVAPDSTGVSAQPYAGTIRHYYQLCVKYAGEKKDQYNYSDASMNTYTAGSAVGATADYRYDSVYSIRMHPKGDVCYNLYADSYSGSSYTNGLY